MKKQIPALAAGAYVDNDGIYHSWSERRYDEANSGWINDYNILEYNHLIDTKNRVNPVFLDPDPDPGAEATE